MMVRRLKAKLRFWVSVCVPCLALLGPRTAGAEAAPERSELLEHSWTVGNESRWQMIHALLETRDGYLWIGTNRGLTRFDGVRFTDFLGARTPGMSKGSTAIGALWEDSRGDVWAGTNAGVTHYDGARFSTLTTRDGLPDNTVTRIDGDETGAVWIYTRNGVCRWKNGGLRIVHPERDKNSNGPLITDFPSDGPDILRLGLWRRSGSGLERFAYGKWREFPLPYQGKRHEYLQVRSIWEDSLRRVWFALGSEPTTYYEVSAANSLLTHHALPAESFVFFQDRDGFLWLSDHQAHTARWKEGAVYEVPSLRTAYLTHVIQRADGALWAGTLYTKLFLFKPRLFTAIKTPGAPEIGPVVFRRKDGTVWGAGTHLVQLKGKEVIDVAFLGGGKRRGFAAALGEDRFGNLLIGNRWAAGVSTLLGREVLAAPLYSSVTGVVQTILQDSSGDEWFGTTTGLFHVWAGKVERVMDGLSGASVNSLMETAPGQLWAGTDKGPAMLSRGKVQPFPSNCIWKSGAVSSLAKGADGTIWIGTVGYGLVRYTNGSFHEFDESDGLPTDTVYGVDAFDPRYLWLRTDSGLLRIAKQSLRRESNGGRPDLELIQFDENDGLPSMEMLPSGNQGSFQLPDGAIWFSSLGGIASLPRGGSAEAPCRPHAVIEEHVIDSSDLLPSKPDGIVVKPDQTNLEIRYTALGSSRPEQVKFRYQLVGLDDTWVPVHHRRTAFYTHLPPGDYVFRVQAADGDEGEWKQSSAQIAVKVLTPFYKTWWMKSLAIVTLLSAVAVFIEMRRRQMVETQRVRQAFTHRLISSQESERKRIAHELHDGLGQHLALIRTLALLPAKLRHTQQTEEPSQGAHSDSFSSIAEQAAVAIREVEGICYGLRPYQLDRLGLTKAVRSLLRQLGEGNTLVLRSSVDDIDGFFPHDLEITFYRVLQEGISNILKHSQATEADILVACDGTNLRLSICDNGRGFSLSARESTSDSLGLIGITERAEVLGGRAIIESSEQAGTRIVLEVTRARPISNT